MRFSLTLALSAFWSLYSIPLSAQSTSTTPDSTAKPQGSCRVYVSLEEANQQRWTQLLSTPVVMPDATILKTGYRKMEEWDLPKEITPWRPRLEQNEYEKYVAAFQQRKNRHWKGVPARERLFWSQRMHWLARPVYEFLPMSQREQQKIEEYLAKNTNRFPGVCADRNRATYFIEIAHVAWVSSYFASNHSPASPKEARFLRVQQDRSYGPPDMWGGEPKEPATFHRDGGVLKDSPPTNDARPPDFSCAYLFKAEPFSTNKNARVPAYYYCPYGGNLQSVTFKMLEFLSKNPNP